MNHPSGRDQDRSALGRALSRRAGHFAESLLTLLYPEVCAICEEHEATRAVGYVCEECRRRPGHVRPVRPPYCSRCGLPFDGEITREFTCANCSDLELHFDRARAAVVATPFVLGVIHRYKYRGGLWFEPFLSGLLTGAAAPELRRGEWDAIVPVPLHPVRRREREFNQAERLAGALARATGIPLEAGLVRRVSPTRTQALLDRRERAKNVAGVFAVRAGVRMPRRGRYVVVDDVLTTGATTSAVSLALRRAGAERVVVWTVARGI